VAVLQVKTSRTQLAVLQVKTSRTQLVRRLIYTCKKSGPD
jgi:hypothetical protein